MKLRLQTFYNNNVFTFRFLIICFSGLLYDARAENHRWVTFSYIRDHFKENFVSDIWKSFKLMRLENALPQYKQIMAI